MRENVRKQNKYDELIKVNEMIKFMSKLTTQVQRFQLVLTIYEYGISKL